MSFVERLSVWDSNAAHSFPYVAHDLAVDVVVIGGGITGVTAALRLAEAGERVALVEARTICSGVTGRSTAHLTEAVDARYYDIRSRFGVEGARLVARSSRAAIEHIANRAYKHSIECDLVRVPGFLYTERLEDRDLLAREHQAAREAGLRVELDAEVPLPFPIRGSLMFPDQLRIDPRRYVRGLVREAQTLGVAFFEHTRVTHVEDGEPAVVTVESGARIKAGAVFCATHSPLNTIFVHTKLGHYQTYAIAYSGAPIIDALCWDTADPYHYISSASVDGRDYLIVGGEDHKTGENAQTARAFEALIGYSRQRFGTDRPDFEWSAQVIEPIDGLPYIGRNSSSKHVYVATGFSGNGITFGTIAALIVSDLIVGNGNGYAELYHATRVSPSALGAFIDENKKVPVHLIGDRLAGGQVRSPSEISPGEGRTLKLRGKHLAVFRDEQGDFHSVSAVCPHMGCIVKFNDAERTWDCPCHGSRFSVDGEVLDGPAMSPLELHALSDAAARSAS